jgi:hypothetical protein
MQTQRNNPVLDLPADTVSQIVIVHTRSDKGKARRTTSLMNVSATTLAAMETVRGGQGMPTYWARWPDGKVHVHPAPDNEYELEIMGRGGRSLAGVRNTQVPVNQIEGYVGAMQQAQRNHQVAIDRQMEQRVERFTLLGPDV